MKAAVCLLALLSMPIWLWAQAAGEPQGSEALKKAAALFDRGDYTGAIAELEPLSARYPKSAELRHSLGLAYYQQHNYTAAIEQLTAALPLEKEDSPPWRQAVEVLGLSSYLSNRPEDAVLYLERAAAWIPEDSNFLYTLAMSYVGRHDLERARKALAKLYRVKPEDPASYMLLCDMLRQARDFEDAESLLAEIRKHWPNLPQLDYKAGVVALVKEKYSAAETYLLKDLGRDPGHAAAWEALGEVYERTGRNEQGVEAFQRAIWLDSSLTKAYVKLAGIYMDQSRLLLAENTAKQALRLAPQSYEANFLLARIYIKSGRMAEAKAQMAIAEKSRQEERK